ncbi:MAG: electron transfer flavoprotein subunit beta/FixA family protein [Anaerolineae bacterium]|nr:electron transfer flavoprotein subunit beta/FixA family protein [Anaerolineae bacterium]
MRIVVCTKETPDTAAKVEVSADGSVSWGDAPLVINPWDEYAVEEALQLKDRGASGITVLAAGTEVTRDALRHALAMGCDDAVLVDDPTLEQADTLLVSKALAAAVRKVDDVGIVLCGRTTTDGGSGLTPVQIGRWLGWSTLTYVSRVLAVDFAAGKITVERLLEEGRQVVESPLPVVISVVKEINEPRYPSFMGIRKAGKAEIPVWSAADLGLEGVAQVQWGAVSAPVTRDVQCEMITAVSVEEAADRLAEKLIADKVV